MYHEHIINFSWCFTTSGISINKTNYYRDVCYVLDQLPHNYRFALNLCTDRYHFLLAFHAAILKNQINLLPPNQAPSTQKQILEQYESSYVICDQPINIDLQVPIIRLDTELLHANSTNNSTIDLTISPQQLISILFTSGTTGKPQPNYKFWQELELGAKQNLLALELASQPNNFRLIATVPPQHMFGLEFSIVLPLVSGMSFYSGQPFFPADVYQALFDAKDCGILVTTPIHLYTLIKSDLIWRNCNCQLIICATAPLHKDLALQTESQFAAPLLEIYGSTETGAIASRRLTQNDELSFYPGITCQLCSEGFIASGGHLSASTLLNDHIAINSSSNFHLIGRQTDLIKIAGKRASLSELNYRLTQIPGVIDGVFINTADTGEKTQRLAAIVVAPNMQRAEIISALTHWIDPVFLPRPLLLVDALPRNASGKLQQQLLHNLLNQYRKSCT